MPRAGPIGPLPAHQSTAGWGAGGADMKVREAHALAVKLVEFRGLEDWVAMRAEVAVALIVRDDENHIGLTAVCLEGIRAGHGAPHNGCQENCENRECRNFVSHSN